MQPHKSRCVTTFKCTVIISLILCYIELERIEEAKKRNEDCVYGGEDVF